MTSTVATVSVTCRQCGLPRMVQARYRAEAEGRLCASCAACIRDNLRPRRMFVPRVVWHTPAVVDDELQAEACARLLRWALGREDYTW